MLAGLFSATWDARLRSGGGFLYSIWPFSARFFILSISIHEVKKSKSRDLRLQPLCLPTFQSSIPNFGSQ
jgi:hypothetical protein